LNDVSGEFRSCELTGIIGPSGSGKTSLLNILSGFIRQNVFGSIKVNGDDRQDEMFRRNSTYIMQEENLFGLLTVREAMTFAVKLKTGNVMKENQREEKIFSVLETLGLAEKLNDYSSDLSGGERKRLSIAVELVNDPAILFLDEPTTGLDSSASNQCIKLLKQLARDGRTIVCTIHTPSALLFEMFDHIYAMAEGSCIYQGSSKNLVPFLNELDLPCPETYNPSDFLLEIATNAYGSQNSRLVKKIHNGLNEQYRSLMATNNNNNNNNNDGITSEDEAMSKTDHKMLNDIRPLYSSSFLLQFYQLLFRNFLFLTRDKMFLCLRLLVHLVVGLMIGFIYYDIGDDASQIFNIYRFIPIGMGFLAYSGFYSLMVRCKFLTNIFRID
jgi:ABC-type multidrug transport system ATPase subunit